MKITTQDTKLFEHVLVEEVWNAVITTKSGHQFRLSEKHGKLQIHVDACLVIRPEANNAASLSTEPL